MAEITVNMYQAVKGFSIKNRRAVVLIIHLLQAAFANYLAFLLRFEFILIPVHFVQFLYYLPILLLIRILFHLQSGLYKTLWRYSSVSDLMKIMKSVTFVRTLQADNRI